MRPTNAPGFGRGRAALATALLFCAGDASAQAPSTPVSVVQALYAGAEAKGVYSARLQGLLDADERCQRKAGGICRLDFDFLIDGQDTCPDHKGSHVFSTSAESGSRHQVKVAFKNCGPKELRFDLVREGGRWMVDDVRSRGETPWTLSNILRGR